MSVSKMTLAGGPTAHYRLAIDTQPPLGFAILVAAGESTDNPAPTLQFQTSDALSGLIKYEIGIASEEPVQVSIEEFEGTFKLPLQEPGKKQIAVRAIDAADNSIATSVLLEIIPIASPTITFVISEVFSDQEKGITAKGTALPNINVILKLYRKEMLAAESIAESNEKGVWEFTFDEPLRNGDFKILARSQDYRGAISLWVESQKIRVKSTPIIQIGFFQLGKGGAALLLLVILIIGFGGGIVFYKKRREKLALRVSLTESEITKIFQLLKQDVEQLRKSLETPTTADDEYATKRLQENIQKMETYLKKGVEKIKK